MNTTLQAQIQHKIDQKTKPLGALGLLETIAFQIANIQQTLTPTLQAPHLIVFAADHGLADEGVSAYPKAVTAQMVYNFLQGGAAINVFCKQNNIELKIVDAGVDHDFEPHPDLIIAKTAYGTHSALKGAAMSEAALNAAITAAEQIVTDIHAKGCNVIGFGEMGIGNTAASSLLLAKLLNMPIEQLVGRGTGVNDEQLQHKCKVLADVLALHHDLDDDVLRILQHLGGLEIVQMFAAMRKAASLGMIILIDGFIATAAFTAAYKLDSSIKSYAIFCHQSDESAHQAVLAHLGVQPLLQLSLRVGEGTGCALAYPLVQAAVNFLNEMSSFESAQVSNKI